MEKRPTRRSQSHRRRNDQPENTMIGNRISVSVMLCVFFLIITYTGGSASQNIREKTAALISRNVLNEFEVKGNIKDNITAFVHCMLSIDEKEKPAAVNKPLPAPPTADKEADKPPQDETPPE